MADLFWSLLAQLTLDPTLYSLHPPSSPCWSGPASLSDLQELRFPRWETTEPLQVSTLFFRCPSLVVHCNPRGAVSQRPGPASPFPHSGSGPGLSLPGTLGVVVTHGPVRLWPPHKAHAEDPGFVDDRCHQEALTSRLLEVLEMECFQLPGIGPT